MSITALELLKIYSVVLFMYFLIVCFRLRTRYTSKIIVLFVSIIISVAGSLGMYGLGWLFLVGMKWLLAQFGIVIGNDIVYVIIWIVLNSLSGVRYLL